MYICLSVQGLCSLSIRAGPIRHNKMIYLPWLSRWLDADSHLSCQPGCHHSHLVILNAMPIVFFFLSSLHILAVPDSKIYFPFTFSSHTHPTTAHHPFLPSQSPHSSTIPPPIMASPDERLLALTHNSQCPVSYWNRDYDFWIGNVAYCPHCSDETTPGELWRFSHIHKDPVCV